MGRDTSSQPPQLEVVTELEIVGGTTDFDSYVGLVFIIDADEGNRRGLSFLLIGSIRAKNLQVFWEDEFRRDERS